MRTRLALALVLSAVVGPLPLVPLVGPSGAPAAALTCGASVDAADGEAALHAAVAAAGTAEPGCDAWTVALTGTFVLTSPLVHAASIPLRLAGPAGARATLQGGGSTRLIAVRRPATDLELVHIELRGGVASGGDADGLDGAGGAVVAEVGPLGDPTPGRVTIVDALLIGNSAVSGGAIAADEVVLTDVDLVANSATRGGAVDAGRLHAERTQFVANAATLAPGQGGAVRAGGDVTLATVTFTGNEAVAGGSVWLSGLAEPVLRATATTFADARADAGGHLYADGSLGGSVTLVLRGSVLTGVTARSGGGPVPAVCEGMTAPAAPGVDGSVHALASDASCPGAAALDAAPVLLVLAGDAGRVDGRARLFAPAGGGPLVDVADCAGVWPAVDARGVARPQPLGGACDLGAVELSASGGDAAPPGPDADGGDVSDAGDPRSRPAAVRAGWSPLPARVDPPRWLPRPLLRRR